MATSTSTGSASTGSDTVTVRSGPRPGDLGRVLSMHAELYSREYGFDEGFEAHVARGLAGFAAALGQVREQNVERAPGRLWLAERAGEVVGTVALTDEGDGVGQLRWFLVAPGARGSGLGRLLVRTLLDYARGQGYTHVKLWTVHVLDTAARLYTEMGFRCTERHPTRQFGQDLDELRYDLDLV
jgi:GNAT superfamily N-acetyltransferase